MASIKVTKSTSGSFTVKLTGCQIYKVDTRHIFWEIEESKTGDKINYKDEEYVSVIEPGESESTEVTLDGLKAATKYTIRCIVQNIDSGEVVNSTLQLEDAWTLMAVNATFKEPTIDGISFTLKNIPVGSFDYVIIYVDIYDSNKNRVKSKGLDEYEGDKINTTESFSFDGLKSGEEYTIKIIVYGVNGDYTEPDSEVDKKIEFTVTTKAAITLFSWTYSGAKLTGSKLVPMKGATKDGSLYVYITVGEWNGLTAKINEARGTRGETEYPFDEASEDKYLTVGMYNQVVNALCFYTHLPEVDADTDITAGRLNLLKDTVNEIIENI